MVETQLFTTSVEKETCCRRLEAPEFDSLRGWAVERSHRLGRGPAGAGAGRATRSGGGIVSAGGAAMAPAL